MGYLEKEFILHRRGGDGELLPIDYFIKELNASVNVIPVTRGEFFELGNSAISREQLKNSLLEKIKKGVDVIKKAELSEEIDKINKEREKDTETFVINHINIPKFTLGELSDAKTIKVKDKNGEYENKNIIGIFMNAIHAVSGVEIDVEKEEEEIKKK